MRHITQRDSRLERADSDYCEADSGLFAAAAKGDTQVKRIVVTGANRQQSTEKGVRIGSAVETIFAGHGKCGYERTEQGARIFGYADQKARVTLEFWTHNGIVREIRFDDTGTG
ncbi:hypothetical protein [Paenibacillus sp. GYB003]|uniref:hypothetical protein n=1 Tax=Paenibacillus sp. GYB003 TaxID=2994392 RepID=UPI002F96DF75